MTAATSPRVEKEKDSPFFFFSFYPSSFSFIKKMKEPVSPLKKFQQSDPGKGMGCGREGWSKFTGRKGRRGGGREG